MSVKNIWGLVWDISDIIAYFPDYKEGEFMKEYLCLKFYELKKNSTKQVIKKDRENRSVKMMEDEMNLVSMYQQLKEELFSLPTLKSEFINLNLFTFLVEIRNDSIKPIYLATKGRSNFLLKKGSILRKRRAETRKFEVNVSALNRDEQESPSSNRRIPYSTLSSPPCEFGRISVFEKIFNKKFYVKNYAFGLTVNKIFLF